MNVQELIAYLQKLPPDTKVKVLSEVQHNWNTSTQFDSVTEYANGRIDGIEYIYDHKTVYFGNN